MPSGSAPKRRRSKSSKKFNNPTALISHSTSTIQLQAKKGKQRVYSSLVSVRVHQSVSQMENSSNGELEETQKIEFKEEAKEVVVEAGCVEDIAIVGMYDSTGTRLDDKDLSLNDQNNSTKEAEAEPDEKSPQVVDLSLSKDHIEVEVEEYSVVTDVMEFASEGKEERVFPFLIETNGLSPVERNEVLIINAADKNDGSKGTEESKLLSLDENRDADAPYGADLESKIHQPVRDVNLKETNEENGESSGSRDDKANENLDDSVHLASVNGSGNKAEVPENTNNPPVISLTKRTSWLGCCGFFQVLRRSDR